MSLVRIPPEAALLFEKKELSSSIKVVSLLCLVSLTDRSRACTPVGVSVAIKYMYHTYMYIGRCLGGLITLAYSLMLRLSNPVYQGRDAICFVQTLKIQPAQLSCLGGSAGTASA